MTSPTALHGGVKRAYQADELPPIQPYHGSTANTGSPPTSSASATSAFRNVSACNRCRVRKNRCDQRLPACSACEKANVKCVGYDPITKREIPRSYVYYLETRLSYFESLLVANGISFNQPEAFDADSKLGRDGAHSPTHDHATDRSKSIDGAVERNSGSSWDKKQEDENKLNKLVSNIGMVSVEGASDPRYLGSTSGISFARVVFAAVKSSVSTNNSERGGVRPSKPITNVASSGGSTMRDSYFGLQTRPNIKKAPFPDRQLGEKLVNLYFEHANPQIPILHRGEFMDLFAHAYASENRTPRDLYLLNIVFAIGAGTIFGSSDPEPSSGQHSDYSTKRARLIGQQCQPEEYHASAIEHLESFLGSGTQVDKIDGFGGGLEELQAVLLLASFALLRPVAPGLWYITGVAVRLGVDLGLHYEDGSDIDPAGDEAMHPAGHDVSMTGSSEEMKPPSIDAKERGRREWVRDLRRRLWWCVYTFDRLVSTCVGRPFGITDQVVTTEFPSVLDDAYITKQGFLRPPPNSPSYKRVSHHYLRLRLLQSEILQVLQHQQAEIARANGANRNNDFMHKFLPSPFMSNFSSFQKWRKDVDRRLWEWKEQAPLQNETGVNFQVQFLELNYWQAVIMLYRQSLSTPPPLANEFSPTEGVSSPTSTTYEDKEDEDEVFLKCAEAGQKTLKLYRQLHRMRLVNYTYLATHHLFMAGISFLYAVWHSPIVRSRLTLDDVDFTVLAATSVLGDLMAKCPPAEACRDAFERMSKATVQMCMSTTGFGFGRDQDRGSPTTSRTRPSLSSMMSDSGSSAGVPVDPSIKQEYSQQGQPQLYQQLPTRRAQKSKRPQPRFDMNLRDLFPDDLDSSALMSQNLPHSMVNMGRSQQQQTSMAPPQSAYQQQQQQQQQYQPQHDPQNRQAPSINSAINAGLGMDANPAAAGGVNPAYAQQQQSQSSMPYYNTSVYGSDFVSIPGMEFDFDPNLDASGIDLGFGGLGLDFQHDWSDPGVGVDLFDGFFFGNASGGTGGNGNGNGNGTGAGV